MRTDKSKDLAVALVKLCNGHHGGDVIVALADALGMALVAVSDDRQHAVVGYSYATNLVKSWLTEDANYGYGIAGGMQ